MKWVHSMTTAGVCARLLCADSLSSRSPSSAGASRPARTRCQRPTRRPRPRGRTASSLRFRGKRPGVGRYAERRAFTHNPPPPARQPRVMAGLHCSALSPSSPALCPRGERVVRCVTAGQDRPAPLGPSGDRPGAVRPPIELIIHVFHQWVTSVPTGCRAPDGPAAPSRADRRRDGPGPRFLFRSVGGGLLDSVKCGVASVGCRRRSY